MGRVGGSAQPLPDPPRDFRHRCSACWKPEHSLQEVMGSSVKVLVPEGVPDPGSIPCSLPREGLWGRAVGQGFGAGSGAARCGLDPLVLDLQRSRCELCAWLGGALFCFFSPSEMVRSREAWPLSHCPHQPFPTNSYIAFPAFLAARGSLKPSGFKEQRSGKLRAARIPRKTHHPARAHCWAEPPGWAPFQLCRMVPAHSARGSAPVGSGCATPKHRECLQYLTATSQSCFAHLWFLSRDGEAAQLQAGATRSHCRRLNPCTAGISIQQI